MKKSKPDIIAQQEAALQGEKPKSKVQVAVNIVVDVLLVLALIMAVIATYTSFVSHSGSGVANIFGFTPFSVQTESMSPTFRPGDLIISKVISHDELTKLKSSEYDEDGNRVVDGDIITYWTTINGQQVLNTHRIVKIYDGGDHLIFETRGDGNGESDPLTVHEGYVVGVYTGTKFGGVGKVFDFFQTSTGFLICVVIPVLLFFIYNLVLFFRSLFEYQNVKTLIQYEEERERNESDAEEDLAAAKQATEEERKRLEQELREKIRAEMLAEMQKEEAETPLETTTETDGEEQDPALSVPPADEKEILQEDGGMPETNAPSEEE